MNETEIMLRILDALRRSGSGLFWRNNTGKLKDARGRWVTFGLGVGSPDIVGILRPSGRLIGFEVKTAIGKTTPEQQAWHRAASEAGATVTVVRTVEEALDALAHA